MALAVGCREISFPVYNIRQVSSYIYLSLNSMMGNQTCFFRRVQVSMNAFNELLSKHLDIHHVLARQHEWGGQKVQEVRLLTSAKIHS